MMMLDRKRTNNVYHDMTISDRGGVSSIVSSFVVRGRTRQEIKDEERGRDRERDRETERETERVSSDMCIRDNHSERKVEVPASKTRKRSCYNRHSFTSSFILFFISFAYAFLSVGFASLARYPLLRQYR